jgi:hypothetical protein
MSITFHCNHCGRKIEAPDSAGGKWAPCPSCHNKIYIPGVVEDVDDLKLAPIDETGEERRKRLIQESYQINQAILEQRDVPEGSGMPSQGVAEISDENLTERIVTYLRRMADGELERAQSIAAGIKPHRAQAMEIVDRIALSDMPDKELADIPPQVLSGMIRNLRDELS